MAALQIDRAPWRLGPAGRRWFDIVLAATLLLPFGQLAIVVAVAGVAGLLAGVLPARGAARTAPAAGLALE